MAKHDELARLREAGKILVKVEQALRVYQLIGWPQRTKQRFFAQGATELPSVQYDIPDVQNVHEAVRAAKKLVTGDSMLYAWMRRQAAAIGETAHMLEAVGTKHFFRHSCALYGSPTASIRQSDATPLQLARRVERLLRKLDPMSLGSEPEYLNPTVLAQRIQARVDHAFGDAAPTVEVVDKLSAKATAGERKIKIRADAEFTKEDIEQLVMHEAMVHVVTTLNGKAQTKMPVLGARHAGTVRTQEGLAVFSELVSGALGPSRLRRLALRTLAIAKAIDGADFIQLYRFFLERHGNEGQAFEDARRIVRGGIISGGAPFTKDGVYLDGLVRVHNFLRASVELRRPDLMVLLFCGKLDLDDIPAIARLHQLGAVTSPKYLAPWLQDRRFIVSYLAYSGFLDRIKFGNVREHYNALLAACPTIDLGGRAQPGSS